MINPRPVVDAAKCFSCKACVEACPKDAIACPLDLYCAKCMKYCAYMEVPCGPPVAAICYERCDGCGACVAACPQHAMTWRWAEQDDEPADPSGRTN